MPAIELHGRAAAPGLAIGALHRLVERPSGRRSAGTPAAERAALAAAIEAADLDDVRRLHKLALREVGRWN